VNISLKGSAAAADQSNALEAKSKGVDDVADTNEREERNYMDHIEVEETKRDKGFTLVELLIVIVILGILATVTVFAVTGITNRGKTSACDSDKKVLQTAEEAFSANTGNYTASQQALQDAGLIHEITGNYTIALVAADPVAGTAASYSLTGVAGTDCEGFTG
jgi:prepilin-type N-terminal cleavage/methylation domain-containing protein